MLKNYMNLKIKEFVHINFSKTSVRFFCFVLSALFLSCFFLAAAVQPALAVMHFVHPDGLFNFSLKSSGWFDNPINDQLFFNLTPAMSLLIENDSQNVLLTVSPLDSKMYGDTIDSAYKVMLEKISMDSSNVIFLKNDYFHNGIYYKDIVYKDKNDLSNVRILISADGKKTMAFDERIYAIIFYFPTGSDFINSGEDVNFLLKTFMYKTQLAEPLDDNLVSLGKSADCIGEYLSLYETNCGIVALTNGRSKLPLFKDPLVKFNQILETNEGLTSFKLNDGTLGFVNSKSRIEFFNMANLKLERGEIIIKSEQRSSFTTIHCGNFIEMKINSGLFSAVCNSPQDSNVSCIIINVAQGSAEVSFEAGILPSKKLIAGDSYVVEISDAGKVISHNIKKADDIKIEKADPDLWLKPLVTHKVVETLDYLKKLKSFEN